MFHASSHCPRSNWNSSPGCYCLMGKGREKQFAPAEHVVSCAHLELVVVFFSFFNNLS